MAHVKLVKPFHNRKAGDVVDIPATVARKLQNEGKAHGGAIDTSEVKEVDFSVPTPEDDFEEGVETVDPKTSSDYTIAELKDMDLSDKDDSFFEGDDRSSIDDIRG